MNTFDDIIGYQPEKEEIMRLADAWKNPQKYRALGVEIPRAVLLYGEPGVGKTLFANALIEASGLPCLTCRKNSSDGAFVAAIAQTFTDAAESSPSIVFLDDMDKFAEDNLQQDSNKEEFATVQSCMERVREQNVFVVATANDICNLPASLMREGRFGRRVLLTVPGRGDAERIIAHYLHGKNVTSDVTAGMLAVILDGCSCAVLESVVNEAGLSAGYEGQTEIGRTHLIRAVLRVLMHATKKNADPCVRTYAAYHEAGHALTALALGRRVGLVSIFGSGERGGVCTVADSEHPSRDMADYLDKTVIALGGKAAIEVRFGQADVGCHRDLDIVVEQLRPVMTQCCAAGFAYGYDHDSWEGRQAPLRVERISDKLYATIEECCNRAKAVLTARRPLLDAVAEALLQNDALLEDDLSRLVAAYPVET